MPTFPKLSNFRLQLTQIVTQSLSMSRSDPNLITIDPNSSQIVFNCIANLQIVSNCLDRSPISRKLHCLFPIHLQFIVQASDLSLQLSAIVAMILIPLPIVSRCRSDTIVCLNCIKNTVTNHKGILSSYLALSSSGS